VAGVVGAFAVASGLVVPALAPASPTSPPEPRKPPLAPKGTAYVKLRVLSARRAQVLGKRQVSVRVRAVLPVRVRLDAYAVERLPKGRRITPRAVLPRTVVFRKRGVKTLKLRLTAAGLRRLRACARTSLNVRAVPRRLHPLPITRVRQKVAAKLVVGRDDLAFPAELGACRQGILPIPSATKVGGQTTFTFVAERGYFVGAASRSINPDANGTYAGKPVYLGGFGIGSNTPYDEGRPATGILAGGVSVRAFAISDGTRSIALADLESQGWFVAQRDAPYGLMDMRKEVEKRTKGALKATNVVVQSDHTHGGPDGLGVWGGVPIEYRKLVFDRTVEAIVEAYQTRREGTLYYGTAPGRDLLTNQFDYDPANKVMDSDVRVLQARDEFNRPFVTVLDFSAHADVAGSGNTKVTGDWPQHTNPLLEQRFGGKAVTVVATLGRTQPNRPGCPGSGDANEICKLDTYSRSVVDRAAQAVANARAVPGKPVVDGRSYLIEDVTSNPLLLGLLVGGPAIGAPLNRALTPPWLTGNVLGTVGASMRIGDVLLSAFPGEAYPQIALKIAELAKDAKGFMTAGLANDQLGYLIAPYESYPEPIRRSFFNQEGDEISPIDNDNYFFNVSQTMGERVTCAALRGAGELFGKGSAYWQAYERCPMFANDMALPAGADTLAPYVGP
jgi:hypothetical protein